MNEITVPESLRGIPQPWNLTHFSSRLEKIKQLDRARPQVVTALDVLEHLLKARPELPPIQRQNIPDELFEYWMFTAAILAERMPTLQDFDMSKVEEVIQERMGTASAPVVKAVAGYWLRSTVNELTHAVLGWLEDVLRHDTEGVDNTDRARIMSIARRYWQTLGDDLATRLIAAVTVIAWKDALPFLEEIEKNPHASTAVRNETRNYHAWVIGSKE